MMLEGLEEGGLVLSPALQTGALGLLLSGELRLCSGDLLRCRTRAGGGAALTSPVHRWVGDEQGDDTVPSSGATTAAAVVVAAAAAAAAPRGAAMLLLLLLQLERNRRPHGLQAAPRSPGRGDRTAPKGAGRRGGPIAPHPLGHSPPPPR